METRNVNVRVWFHGTDNKREETQYGLVVDANSSNDTLQSDERFLSSIEDVLLFDQCWLPSKYEYSDQPSVCMTGSKPNPSNNGKFINYTGEKLKEFNVSWGIVSIS